MGLDTLLVDFSCGSCISDGSPAWDIVCLGLDYRACGSGRSCNMGIVKKKALKQYSEKRNAEKVIKHERPPELKGKKKRIKN